MTAQTFNQFKKDLSVYYPSSGWVIESFKQINGAELIPAIQEIVFILADKEKRWSYVSNDPGNFNEKTVRIFFIKECRAYDIFFKQINYLSLRTIVVPFYAFYFSQLSYVFIESMQTCYGLWQDPVQFFLLLKQLQACLHELTAVAQQLSHSMYDHEVAMNLTRYRELFSLLLQEKKLFEQHWLS